MADSTPSPASVASEGVIVMEDSINPTQPVQEIRVTEGDVGANETPQQVVIVEQAEQPSEDVTKAVEEPVKTSEPTPTDEVIDGPFEESNFVEQVEGSSDDGQTVEMADSTHETTPSIVVVPPQDSQSSIAQESTTTVQPLTIKRTTVIQAVRVPRTRDLCRYHLVKKPVLNVVLGRDKAAEFGTDMLRQLAYAAGKPVVPAIVA